MRKSVSLFLAALFLTFSFSVSAVCQEKDVLAEANQLFAERKYAEAEQSYLNLLKQKIDEPTRAKVIFNLGMTYKQLKQYDKAIQTFNQIFTMSVNDREAGGSIMQAYRNYRPSAQWEIGKARFAKGDYEGAYLAFRTTQEKYPFQSWCGTCQGGYERDYAMYQAISLEHLGRHREAVAAYWRIYEPRLAELYHAAGQMNDLKAILDKKDEAVISEGMQKYAWTREKASEYLQTRYLREAVEVYDLEKAGNWSGLLKIAVKFMPLRGNGRGNPVAAILARHPKEVLPLIKQEMSRPNEKTPFLLYYDILGLAATDESVGYLKDLAAKQANWWQVAAMVRALSLAGEKGENAIRELEANAKDNLKLAIERHKKGELQDERESEVKFPVVKVNEKLPADL